MNNPPETVRDAIYRLDQELGSAAERSEDIATICAHITALAAEVEGLREKDRRDAEALDNALNTVQELQAKLAACEADARRWRTLRRKIDPDTVDAVFADDFDISESQAQQSDAAIDAAMQEKPHG